MKRGARSNQTQGPTGVPGSGTLSMGGFYALGGSYGVQYVYIPADGKHAYVGTGSSWLISCFTRDTNTGALTPLATQNITCTGSAFHMTGNAAGTRVYVGCSDYDYIRLFNRNTTTGVLSNVASYNCSTSLKTLTMSPDELHMYGVSRGANVINQFSINATTGALTALSPASFAPTGASSPHSLAFTRSSGSGISGKYGYIGNFNAAQINCVVRDTTTGLLSDNPAQASIAVPAGAIAAVVKVSPDDKHLYVAYDGTSKMAVYSINQTNGSLTLIDNSVVAYNGPWYFDISPDGKYVYVPDSDGQTISQYSRNASTGMLTPMIPAKVRSDPYFTAQAGSGGPQAVTVSPDGKHVYPACSFSPYSVPWFNIQP